MRLSILAAALTCLSASSLSGQARVLDLDITAAEPRFEAAVGEYRAIWEAEGRSIVEAMERATGLEFEAGPVPVVVYEGPSSSGFRDIPMRMRASYPEATKRATLVHELAHRLISELVPKDFDDHPVIFLFIYDVWVELWGQQFADEQVAVESRRRGIYDYETAWTNTLELTAQERAARFEQFLISRGAAQMHRGRLPNRPESFIAATRVFAFYSDPVMNLHDFLLRGTRTPESTETAAPCLGALRREDREAFERARRHYEQAMADRRWNDDLVLALRWELAGFSEVDFLPDTATAPTLEQLSAALRAYTRCWWPDHDARNRVRIAQLVRRLIVHEDALIGRLAVVFQAEWSPPFPVDIVGWTSSSGANTVVDPDHIVMSSANPGYDGDSGLEMVFHEAAHTILGPGNGTVWRALEEAGASVEAEELPGTLWHPVLFYTTGKVVETLLAQRGTANYEPYMYRRGLFERAWPELRQPLEQHWQPYLDGRIGLDDAARRLLEAVREAAPRRQP